MDYAVAKRPYLLSYTKERRRRGRKHYQHLCLDRVYNSKLVEKEIIKCGYVPHIPYKRKRGEHKIACQKKYQPMKNKRWVVWERTNSWHNKFRKLFTRYEKKVENYLGLVQLLCSIIIYRKIILGSALRLDLLHN